MIAMLCADRAPGAVTIRDQPGRSGADVDGAT